MNLKVPRRIQPDLCNIVTDLTIPRPLLTSRWGTVYLLYGRDTVDGDLPRAGPYEVTVPGVQLLDVQVVLQRFGGDVHMVQL